MAASSSIQYHVRWWSDPYTEMDEQLFDREDQVIAFINEQMAKYREAHFKVFYGRYIDLEPAEVIRSYKFKK